MEKASYFPFFLAFSTTENAFSEGFETGILTTSDWRYCQFFSWYHWKAHIYNWPIGIVFSKDASIPTWDISNLGVDCDEIAMSWIDSQVFNLFEVERNFLVPNAVVT